MRGRGRVLRPPGHRGLATHEPPPSCPSWCRVAHRPHHPARGLHSKTRTRQNPPEMDQAREPGRRSRAAPRSRASPGAARPRSLGKVSVAPPCVPCSPLVLHLGALSGVLAEEWGFVCLKGPFPLDTLSLSFCILYFKHQKKKNGIGARFCVRGQLFYLMHS